MKIELEVIPCHVRMPEERSIVTAYDLTGGSYSTYRSGEAWLTTGCCDVKGVVAWSCRPTLTPEQLSSLKKPEKVTEEEMRWAIQWRHVNNVRGCLKSNSDGICDCARCRDWNRYHNIARRVREEQGNEAK